jgi:hypothetical protein
MMEMHKVVCFKMLSLNFSGRVEENYENVRIADFWPRFNFRPPKKKKRALTTTLQRFLGKYSKQYSSGV